MNKLNSYITFLQEYKKLLERGVKNIFAKSVSPNFIWLDDIEKLIEDNLCETTFTDFFIGEYDSSKTTVLSLKKPLKPQMNIPFEYSGIIEFNDAKNRFESEDENDLNSFRTSEIGIREIKKIKRFTNNKAVYSKLYRAYNDIKNDSNIEIVLSVALIQYAKQGRGKTNSVSKTNQHLFHFPLEIELTSTNIIELSFSETDKPYVDFFFLNNTPIEKGVLNNIIDRFDEEVETNGFHYIYEKRFKDLISKELQQISVDSTFEKSVSRPSSDTVIVDSFKFSYSPSINIKKQKPRFFDKLTKEIIEKNENQEVEAELFNLLIRNPDNKHTNSHVKSNYFIDELYEEHKENKTNLHPAEDFSVFFPLPYNKEQKQIYENYLKNRITVVTGPPGTGKSHTIVNILCSLLAQGKRVLITAQTDKALESLLDKIPPTFDDLVFTKIQLEVNKTRFTLEKSINNIRSILIDDFHLNIEKKIASLDTLKGEYLQLKSTIHQVLEAEYNKISINDSFQNLRSYELWAKFESKNSDNWDWIKDEVTEDLINQISNLRNVIQQYKLLEKYENTILKHVDFDISIISKKINEFDFTKFLKDKNTIEKLKTHLDIDDFSKSKLLEIDLASIKELTEKYTNSDIVVNSFQQISQLKNKLKTREREVQELSSNLKYSEIVENGSKYLRDIESYLAQIENDKEKVGFLSKFKSQYKQVNYLEKIVLNSRKCNNKSSLKLLRVYLKEIQQINKILNEIIKAGFTVSVNEDSDLSSKETLLGSAIEQVDRNFELLELLQKNTDIIKFANVFNIELSNVEKIYKTAVSYKEDLEKLKGVELSVEKDIYTLKSISEKFESSKLLKDFEVFIPLENISDTTEFSAFQAKLNATIEQIDKENQFNEAQLYLKQAMPMTFPFLSEISIELISKENLEFAHVNNYFKINRVIDLQKTKEKLTQINQKIYEIKCEILFDLAKSNFKNSFEQSEIDRFINLLVEYRNNLYQGSRGIRDKVKFQLLARRNSAKISCKLSCWVMKFNDVLNSVGTESEVFDCIIVDEASQLDFNSLILGYYAKNMIIVGDDKQTSPSALTGANDNDFQAIKNKYLEFLGDAKVQIRSDNSLFTLSKMIAGSSNLELKEHFRCVAEIIEFSKFNFYNNSLKPLKQINTENRLQPIKAIFVQDSFLEEKIVYKEIEAIKKELIKIINSPVYQNKTIGVVSLGLAKHTEKLKDIKEDLSELFGREKLDNIKLIIEDSPKFQGDERDVMLVSLGVALDAEKLKSNDNPKPRSIVDDGKLKDDFKKINVALSRAKEQMILFHSVKSENLRNNDFRLKILSFFYNDNKVLTHFDLPENENERNKYNIPTPFDSWFEYDIASELIDKGYLYIQPQYEVKEDETFYNHHSQKVTYVNFRLDLVVTNNGKLVAIECDGDPFHSLPEDVAYDVERQEFLERVGWKVYRILYSAYKRNPSLEIERMVNFIELHTKKDIIVSMSSKDITTVEINRTSTPIKNISKQAAQSIGSNERKFDESSIIEGHKTQGNIQSCTLLFSEKGRCYWLNSSAPIVAKDDLQVEISKQVSLQIEDKICSSIFIQNLMDTEFLQNNYVVFCTIKGIVKKTILEEFSRPRSGGIKAIFITEGDQLVDAKLTNGKSEILLANKNGRAIRFPESKVQPMPRSAAGVRGLKLDDENDEAVGLVSVGPSISDRFIIVLSSKGKGKRIPIEDYRMTNRGGIGVKTFKTTYETGNVIAFKVASLQDDLKIITALGRELIIAVINIKNNQRESKGFNVIKLNKGDSISEVIVQEHYTDNESTNLEKIITDEKEIDKEDKVLRYFNLNSDGLYKLEKFESPTATYSIPIKESDKNGYLLQGYDNGHLNKVLISSLLSKRLDREYKNGINTSASLKFLKVIKEDEIFGLHFHEKNKRKFKAHLTKNISNKETLHLQGNKVIYNDFNYLEYQIFPIDLLNQLDRLVYSSFTATGKSLDNSNYEKEWRVIKSYINSKGEGLVQPNLFDTTIKMNSKVKLKYLNTNKEYTIRITESGSGTDMYGVQEISLKSLVATSIVGKEIGAKIRIGNTENIVEIIEVMN